MFSQALNILFHSGEAQLRTFESYVLLLRWYLRLTGMAHGESQVRALRTGKAKLAL